MHDYRVVHKSPTVHIVDTWDDARAEHWDLYLSDLHIDNTKCRRDILKRLLAEAQDKNAFVYLGGDTLDIMQGREDRRRNKSTLMDEHKRFDYVDAVIEDAAEFLNKYAPNLVWIGTGNHETAVIKRLEVNILKHLQDRLNRDRDPANMVALGGYRSWIVRRFWRANGSSAKTFITHFFHGTGGGGAVTGSRIKFNRDMMWISGADALWQGHYHDLDCSRIEQCMLDGNHNNVIKPMWWLQTSTLKDEFDLDVTNGQGWHIERGARPKPLGGIWLRHQLKPGRELITSPSFAI